MSVIHACYAQDDQLAANWEFMPQNWADMLRHEPQNWADMLRHEVSGLTCTDDVSVHT